MRVAVFGSGGMLGQAVVEALIERGVRPCAFSHKDWDITGPPGVDISREGWDAAVNCAGIIPQKGGTHLEMARVNDYGAHVLADLLGRYDVPLVHISTDCVFSGRPESDAGLNSTRLPDFRYTTSHRPDPVDAYGRTNLAGERPFDRSVTTVRTSFIGLKHGLARWFLDAAVSGQASVDGWSTAFWTGGTVWAVARALVELAKAPPGGIQHLASEEKLSKYQVLTMIKEAVGLDIEIRSVVKPWVDRALEATVKLPSLEDSMREFAERWNQRSQ